VPQTLHATLSNGTGGCTCLNGQSVTLSYTAGGGGVWQGTVPAGCGSQTNLELQCNPGSGVWTLAGAGPCTISTVTPTTVCSPLSITFANQTVTNCCSGTITITVTS
jgi:hypothetical protein